MRAVSADCLWVRSIHHPDAPIAPRRMAASAIPTEAMEASPRMSIRCRAVGLLGSGRIVASASKSPPVKFRLSKFRAGGFRVRPGERRMY